jgi:5-(carboxyamino)imidazole ribonucleotide synthase
MMTIAARAMGYRVIVLDPSSTCPTAQVADGCVVGALDDLEAARRLAAQVDVITLDTEHVPAEMLAELERQRPVRPGARVLAVIQDRMPQKQFLDRLGHPQARWAPASSLAELTAATAHTGFPAIVKHRRWGYDGKGQVRVGRVEDLARAWETLHAQPCVVESVVQFRREISVVLARAVSGEIQVYPIAENAHRNHVLHTTCAPAMISAHGRATAERLAIAIASALDHVGVMAVEMFELDDGSLLINEIAPRTHNSGHFTYGACATSQFEQHVRAVCGLPLANPTPLSAAAMLNLTGELWARGTPRWHHVLSRPDAHLHLYGKATAGPGRKMGHVLLLADDPSAALAAAGELFAALASAPGSDEPAGL